MIIGISGKKQAGKDTIGKIICYLTHVGSTNYTIEEWLEEGYEHESGPFGSNIWEVKKFADKLKQMASLMLGISVEDFEKEEVKNRVLGEEWTSYGTAKGFWSHSDGNPLHKMMDSVPCDKETYEAERRINWQTAYKRETTVRLFLQLLGTEAIRNTIHINAWVNALMCDYKKCFDSNIKFVKSDGTSMELNYPNWIITDVRFPNELSVVDGKGFSIRVNRSPVGSNEWITYCKYLTDNPNEKGLIEIATIENFYKWANEHPSETALDAAKFNYTIENNGTIEELIEKVKQILIDEKII